MFTSEFIENLKNEILANKNLGNVKLVNFEDKKVPVKGNNFVREINLSFYFSTKLLHLIIVPNLLGFANFIPNAFYSLINPRNKFSNLISALLLPFCYVWQNNRKTIAITKEIHDILLRASQKMGCVESLEPFYRTRAQSREKDFWSGSVTFFFEEKNKEGERIVFDWGLVLHPRSQENLFELIKSKIYLKDGSYPNVLNISITEPINPEP